jgi:hypothetical protein
MLRLYKSLSIQNDVFSKIPRDQLKMPAASGEGEEEAPRFLDMKSSRLALVGQEDDGILLFAHDGYAKVPPPGAASSLHLRSTYLLSKWGFMWKGSLCAHATPNQDAAGKASKRTFINMYDMKTRELTALFMHDYVIDVVSCSVNEERTLLGLASSLSPPQSFLALSDKVFTHTHTHTPSVHDAFPLSQARP